MVKSPCGTRTAPGSYLAATAAFPLPRALPPTGQHHFPEGQRGDGPRTEFEGLIVIVRYARFIVNYDCTVHLVFASGFGASYAHFAAWVFQNP